MQRYPTIVRAAVLDVIAPPQIAWPVEMSRRYGDALAVLFHHCRTDSSCDAAFPSLEAVSYRLVERLQSEPIRIRVRDEEHTVDGDDLHGIVWNSLYDLQKIRFLPLMVTRLADGDSGILTRILASWPAGGDSDYSKAEVLVGVARRGLESARVRQAYVEAIDTIDSSYERDRVRRAAGLRGT